PDCLETARGVEGVDADVVVRMGLATGLHLHHDARRIAQVEHRVAPHLPEEVPGMRVVSVLDADGPVPPEAVLDLCPDLIFAERVQDGEGALGNLRGCALSS